MFRSHALNQNYFWYYSITTNVDYKRAEESIGSEKHIRKAMQFGKIPTCALMGINLKINYYSWELSNAVLFLFTQTFCGLRLPCYQNIKRS